MLGLANEKDATYLFMPTSNIYPDPKVTLQLEGYRGNIDSYRPRSCYNNSKHSQETLIRKELGQIRSQRPDDPRLQHIGAVDAT